MVATVDYYRYYVPVCQTLSLTVLPANSTIASQNVDVQTVVYSGSPQLNLNFTPYGTDFVDVFADGVNITNKIVNSVLGGYTHSRFNIVGSMLNWVQPPLVGQSLKIVSYLGTSETKFYTIDLSEMLVQGVVANNQDAEFTGSVECYPVIVHQPINGFVRPAWNKQGFEYSLKSGASTSDSFAYKLVSRYGIESEPKCILINQGS